MNKLLMLWVSVLAFSCSKKIKELNYFRDFNGKQETIKMNLKKDTFVYSVENKNENFTISGIIERIKNRDGIALIFPPYTESKKLSPFKKGYIEVIKTDSSDQIELELSILNRKDILFSDQIQSSLLSNTDSTVIETFDSVSILLEPQNAKNILRIEGRMAYYNQEFIIPEKGKYSIKIYIQPVQTFKFFETTTSGCYLVYTKPTLYTFPCKTENDTVKMFSIDRNCENAFVVVK